MQPPNPYYQHPQPAMYSNPPRPAQRNVGLIVVGTMLLAIATLALLVFAYNAYRYATAEEHFASLGSSSAWMVEIVKRGYMKRMMLFGSIAGIFGGGGLVLGFLGMRKR
ncbi:MAG TPA: hypothetical protein VGH28_04480 [Polyangiaceae bacterium]